MNTKVSMAASVIDQGIYDSDPKAQCVASCVQGVAPCVHAVFVQGVESHAQGAASSQSSAQDVHSIPSA